MITSQRFNDELLDDFDLKYEQMVKKYGNIVDAYYWEGHICFLHEKGTGQYFYGITDLKQDSIAPLDVIIKSDTNFFMLHCKAKELFSNMPNEITVKIPLFICLKNQKL